MEGQKTPAPFAWAWFGAVRSERKPLRYEEEFRKLLHHTHPRRKPMSYFLTPTPDDEDDDDDDDKADTETGAGELGLSQPSTPQTPADKGEVHTAMKTTITTTTFQLTRRVGQRIAIVDSGSLGRQAVLSKSCTTSTIMSKLLQRPFKLPSPPIQCWLFEHGSACSLNNEH